ncbi:MAG TPA: Ig-like domain-containing protein, partial [Terracidiphilus sp.]|nr:Ig-like domain-containing protein [Terracidiphilus sp.]
STFALNGGSYSGNISTLPGGSYNIWASYGGDAKNGAQVSAKIPVTVNPESSGIAFGLFANGSNQYLTSNINTSVDYGTQLMLSARVAPSGDVATIQACTPAASTTKCPTYTSPTGTVKFSDNGSAINTAIINSEGDAEYNAPFAVGTHSVSASYSGDNSYNASTASPIAFTVGKDTPQIFIGASNLVSSNPFQVIGGANQPTVLNVAIENNAQATANSNSPNQASLFPVPVATPTGTVTVTGFPSGVPTTATLSPGVDPSDGAQAGIATITIPAGTAANTYNVSIAYKGDGNYSAVSGSGTVQIVSSSGVATQTTAALAGTISPNTIATITGTVTAQSGSAAPTGQVFLFSSNQYLTSANLQTSSGLTSTFSFVLNSQTLVQGSNFLTVQYAGTNKSPYFLPSAYNLSTGGPLSNPLSDFSLAPDSAFVPITVGGSATDNVELASVNNFTGPVTLTCAAPSGVTCSIPSSPVTLSAGGSASAAVNIAVSGTAAAQNYDLLITAKDATGEYIHTLGIVVNVGSPALHLTNAGTINISSPGGSGTSVFTATPINGFTGSINLSCAVTGAPSGAGSNAITCGASNLSATSLNITGAAAQTSTLTINTTSSTAVGTYQVTVTGTGSTTVTSVVTVAVAVVPPDFAINNGGNITVKAGATSGNTSAITIQSKNSFNSAVSLTCSISPTAASDPATCSFSSGSVTPTANGTAQATLNITTTAATAMNDHKPIFWSTAGSGLIFACALFFWIPKKRRSWLTMFVLLVFLGSMAGMACGGGGGSGGGGGGGGGGNPGTTAGTYTVTVTGTSGTLNHTTTVTLTVQ